MIFRFLGLDFQNSISDAAEYKSRLYTRDKDQMMVSYI